MSTSRILCHALVAWIALPLAVASAGPSGPFALLDQWHRSQRVTDLALTADGYLWAGTDSGLIRFDGLRFETFHRSPEVALPGNVISALVAAPDGSLWIGTSAPPGIGFVRNNRFHTLLAQSGRPDMTTDALAVDREGVLWVGTNFGLFRVQQNQLVRVEPSAIAGAVTPKGIVIDADGALWVATAAGLFKKGASGLAAVLPGVAVLAITPDPVGGVVVSLSPAGVVRITNGDPHRILQRAPTDDPDTDFTTLAFDRQGNLWVGWQGGYGYVSRAQPQQLAQTIAHGLRVVRLLPTPQGDLWAATKWGGVHRLGVPVVRVPGVTEAGAVVFSVTQSHDEALWASYENALVRMQSDRTDVLRTGKELPFWCPRAIAPAKMGGVWVGNCRDGIYRVDAGVVATVVARGNQSLFNIRGLLEDRKGRLWVATGLGQLLQAQNGQLVPHDYGVTACALSLSDDDKSRCKASLSALIEKSDGGLWLGSSQGVFSFNLASTPRHQRLAGLPEAEVLALHEDARGDLYIGTQGNGLLRWRKGEFKSVDATQGLPMQSVHGIIEDGSGNLWLSGERGAARIKMSELDAYFAGQRDRVQAFPHGIEDGMQSSVTMQSFTSTLTKLASGEIAVATADGVAIVSPATALDTTGFVPVFLEELRVAGQRIDTAAEAAPLRIDLRLGQSVFGPVSLRFTSPNFRMARRLRFEYRMAGHQAAWIAADDRRIADFAALPAGNFAFEVRGWLEDKLWQPPATLAHFEIVAFHQRPIFFLLLAACLVPLAGVVYLFRMWQSQARLRAVLAERNRIAMDLHDSLAQFFTGMAYQAEELEILIGTDDAAARAVNREAKELITHCRLESRHTIADLRLATLDAPSLPQGLHDLAEQASLYGKAQMTFVALDAGSVSLAQEVRGGILRIAREAVINALAHGSPRNVRLELDHPEGSVRLRIIDDGQGFDPTALNASSPTHHGVLGMKQRAVSFGGVVDIKSAPGSGTTVEVRTRR